MPWPSAPGFAVTELDHVRSWEKEPAYYLRVAFTGLEQAAGLPSKSARTLEKRFVKRLRAIPDLLALAPHNIEAVSPAKPRQGPDHDPGLRPLSLGAG